MNNNKQHTQGNVLPFIPTGEYYYQKALLALRKEQYDRAHKFLKRAVELSPEDADIRMQYGVLLMEMSEFELSMEALREAQELDPDKPDLLFYLAEAHAHLGIFLEARNFAKRYIEKEPHGEYAAEALEIIDFAEQEDWQLFGDDNEAQDSESYYQQEKSRKLMEQGDFAGAIALLESVIEEKPDFWGAYNHLSLAYFYVGETEMALSLLHDVLRRNKGNLHALCNLAVIHYYERSDELVHVIDMLKKIQPYIFEHRYKLGATFALLGQYKEAYRWLRSLQKRGFNGDPAFYFWLSHSAFHCGYEEAAKHAWRQLIKLDPTKEGYEPWTDTPEVPNASAIEHDREYLIAKLDHPHKSERLFGYFLLGKSSHKQEIVSHPKWLKPDALSLVETFMLGYALGHSFSDAVPEEKAFLQAMKATEILYAEKGMVTEENSYTFQMWFILLEKAYERNYPFKNPNALAAAVDYMVKSSRDRSITKKAAAEHYGITAATLTKYINELIPFFPLFES